MKKRFLTTLLAGAAGLTLAAGAAELSPAAAEKALFDSTARHLDFGGNYYNYLSIDGMPGQFEELFVSMLTASGEADSAEVADVVKLVSGLLNFEVVQAFGSSSIIAADAPGVYVNKSFIRLSEAQPKGVLFDLAGRENRKLAGLKMIPANTRLAFGLHLDPGPAWKTLSAALAGSQNEEVKNLPAEAARQAEQTLGCKFDDFLAGLTGEAFFLLTSDGTLPDIQPKLLLILPDGKGLLAQLLLKHADDLELQKESDTLYTIQAPGLPPFVKPRLILERGRIVIASSADIYDLARAADGGAATAPELAPYFRNMPGDGLGFLYLNVPASLVQSAIQLGATMSEELATLQPTFAQLPGLTVFSVSRKEAEGYAGVMRSNLSTAQLQVAAPMLVYSGMLLPALTRWKGGSNASLLKSEIKFYTSQGYESGRYLARKNGGKKVLFVADSGFETSANTRKLVDAFKKGYGSDNVVVDTVELPAERQNPNMPLPMLMKAKDFDALLDKHPDCGIVVTIIGLPNDFQKMKFQQMPAEKRPDLFLIGLSSGRLPGLVDQVKTGMVTGVITTNPDAQYDVPAPNDPAEAFKIRYLLIDRNNAEQNKMLLTL